MIRKLFLTLVVTLSVTALYAFPDLEAALRRGRDLYASGRWSDARHAFTELKRSLTPDATQLHEECDCASKRNARCELPLRLSKT